VYATDPDRGPDHEFTPGDLSHLVVGNEGRMLDGRRTPVRIVKLSPATGTFTVEITAFEDAGARWELPFEDIASFQFPHDAARADPAAVAEFRRAVARFDQRLVVPLDHEATAHTWARVHAGRVEVRPVLDRIADPADALLTYLGQHDLDDMESAFAALFVSNPHAGELVKGHRIVLAHLGLCAYEGKVLRSPDVFAGRWSEERRAAHIVARLAFVHELFSRTQPTGQVVLWRGVAVEGVLGPPPPRSFVSATFDRAVAEALFEGGPSTTTSALYRQSVPITRLFMTHVETNAMNAAFKESEAVLLADPNDHAF
jgi:hypothetical protein